MNYLAYELAHRGMVPVHANFHLLSGLLRQHPHPLAVGLGAFYDLFSRARITHTQPAFGIESVKVGKRTIPVTEKVVSGVVPHAFAQLLHFEKDTPEPGETVLVIPALSGHFSTLARGTVKNLLERYNVFVVNWRNPRDIPLSEGDFGLDDCVSLVIDYLTFLGPDTNVFAICQAGYPATVAMTVMSMEDARSAPKSLIPVAAPIDTRINPTAPNRFAEAHSMAWFENHAIDTVPSSLAGERRRVYPGYKQLSGFMSMNLDRHLSSAFDRMLMLARGDQVGARAIRSFYEEFLAVIDLTALFYLETVETVFKRHDLPRGECRHRGERIDPRPVTRTAVMPIEGEKDDITGIGQTKAVLDLLGQLPDSKKQYHLIEGCGHYGMFNGSRFRKVIRPKIDEFIRAAT